MKSVLGSLNGKDALKTFIIFVLSTIVGSVINVFQAGSFEFTWVFWKPIVMTDVIVILAYILKNFLTNSNDQFLTSEKK